EDAAQVRAESFVDRVARDEAFVAPERFARERRIGVPCVGDGPGAVRTAGRRLAAREGKGKIGDVVALAVELAKRARVARPEVIAVHLRPRALEGPRERA